MAKRKIVAVACSTGGPSTLQEIIPKLPAKIGAPVVLVQHMPKGFTKILADRLNDISKIAVSEAKDKELILNDHVYIAQAGYHMNVSFDGKAHRIRYSDEPFREGVKPCANYMFESLIDSKFDEIVCVVLTGMGADGAEGIENLVKSSAKKVRILLQDKESAVVYGMPGSVIKRGLDCNICELANISNEIVRLLEG